jgi:hypothetical protein
MSNLIDLPTISLIVTILLALAGYLITHRNQLSLLKRQEQLDLVNKRINDFYGPLYIALQDSQASYAAFLNKVGKTGLTEPTLPNEIELAEWRIWVENVFMPLHQFVEKLILENAYLIREEEVPECLLQFVTHVSGYKALLRKWETGDYSEYLSVVHYPEAINRYAYESYRELKREQLRLIGILKQAD